MSRRPLDRRPGRSGRMDRLKGLGEPVVLHEVRAVGAPPARPSDPVCGMLLGTDEHDVDLMWEDQALGFCSTGCRDRFLAEPQAYTRP